MCSLGALTVQVGWLVGGGGVGCWLGWLVGLVG